MNMRTTLCFFLPALLFPYIACASDGAGSIERLQGFLVFAAILFAANILLMLANFNIKSSAVRLVNTFIAAPYLPFAYLLLVYDATTGCVGFALVLLSLVLVYKSWKD